MKRILVVVLLSFSLHSLYCQDSPVFYWNVGNVNVNYEALKNDWNVELNYAELNWFLFNRIFLGVTVFKTMYDGDKTWYSLLPLEAGYQLSFPGSEYFHIRFYNRLEWQYRNLNSFTSSDSRLIDSVGAKLIIASKIDSLRYNCNFLALLFEYTNRNEFKIGMSVDLVVFFVIIGGLILEG